MMKTEAIKVSKNSETYAHHPSNNEEYHVLISAFQSCGLVKNPKLLCDESWQAWRFKEDGTRYLEFHSIWFDDMEQDVDG